MHAFIHYRAWIITLAVCVAGCGPSRGTIPLQGRVTVRGELPRQAGRVLFTPLPPSDEAEPRVPPGRFALGAFAADGTYLASSFTEGDGILPGRYEVRVELGDMRPAGPDLHGFAGPAPEPVGVVASPLNVRRDGPRAIRHDIDIP